MGQAWWVAPRARAAACAGKRRPGGASTAAAPLPQRCRALWRPGVTHSGRLMKGTRPYRSAADPSESAVTPNPATSSWSRTGKANTNWGACRARATGVKRDASSSTISAMSKAVEPLLSKRGCLTTRWGSQGTQGTQGGAASAAATATRAPQAPALPHDVLLARHAPSAAP